MLSPSSCCKRSLVIVIVLSCVWHLDSGMVRERTPVRVAAPAAVSTIAETAVSTPSGLSLLLSKIKDVFFE
jgi:hypothetical protein